MSEHTPTTERLRQDVVQLGSHSGEMFDRWLAAHDAEVRAGVVAEEPEWWETIVLGRELSGEGDWMVTEWRPDEVEKIRDEFPDSEYALGKRQVVPVKQEGERL